MEQEAWEGAVLAFNTYKNPLVMVASFWYLGRTLTAVDDNWKSFVINLQKEWKVWDHLSRILGREGSDVKKSGRFYIAVVQATLMFWF